MKMESKLVVVREMLTMRVSFFFLSFFLSKELVNVLVGSNPQKSPSAAGGWTHDLFIDSTLIVV